MVIQFIVLCVVMLTSFTVLLSVAAATRLLNRTFKSDVSIDLNILIHLLSINFSFFEK